MQFHEVKDPMDEYIWNLIVTHEGETFLTARGLQFSFHRKTGKAGEPLGELVIDRKEKTLTRNTVLLAYDRALEIQSREGCVSGPKKLGVFGASYLYPIFLALGIISKPS